MKAGFITFDSSGKAWWTSEPMPNEYYRGHYPIALPAWKETRIPIANCQDLPAGWYEPDISYPLPEGTEIELVGPDHEPSKMRIILPKPEREENKVLADAQEIDNKAMRAYQEAKEGNISLWTVQEDDPDAKYWREVWKKGYIEGELSYPTMNTSGNVIPPHSFTEGAESEPTKVELPVLSDAYWLYTYKQAYDFHTKTILELQSENEETKKWLGSYKAGFDTATETIIELKSENDRLKKEIDELQDEMRVQGEQNDPTE